MQVRQLKEEDEPPRPLSAEVIPILAGVKAANDSFSQPEGEVVRVGQIRRKPRSAFDSQVEYDIHVQLCRLQAESLRSGIEGLREAAMVEQEVKPSDLPTPLSGSEAASDDDEFRLIAYLAHHTPLGAGRFIRTVPNTVMVKGQPITAPQRQDHVIREEYVAQYPVYVRPQYVVQHNIVGGTKVVSRRILRDRKGEQRTQGARVVYGAEQRVRHRWNAYDHDGLVFWLSDDRDADRKRALRRTRFSKAKRKAKGKPENTVFQSRIGIGDYRPVPTVLEFLRHPEGHGVIYETPYPNGRVDPTAQHTNEIHNRRASEWMNDTKYLSTWTKRMLEQGMSSSEAVKLHMTMSERASVGIHSRLHSDVDDLPWGDPTPAEPEESVLRLVETEANPETTVTPKAHAESTRQIIEEVRANRIKREERLLATTKRQMQPSYFPLSVSLKAHPMITSAPATSQPLLKGDNWDLLVRPDGGAMYCASYDPKTRGLVGDWMMGYYDSSELESLPPVGPSSEDLADPRYHAFITKQIEQQREVVAQAQNHLEDLVRARWELEARAGIKHESTELAVVNIEYERQQPVRKCLMRDLGISRTKGHNPNYAKMFREQQLLESPEVRSLRKMARTERSEDRKFRVAMIRRQAANRRRIPEEVMALRRIRHNVRIHQYLEMQREGRKRQKLYIQLGNLEKSRAANRVRLKFERQVYRRWSIRPQAFITSGERLFYLPPKGLKGMRYAWLSWKRELKAKLRRSTPNQNRPVEQGRVQPERRTNPPVKLVDESKLRTIEPVEDHGLLLPEQRVVAFGNRFLVAEMVRQKREELLKGGVPLSVLNAEEERMFKPRAWPRFVEHAEKRSVLVA